ncbi:MAG: HigA family addiction module antidote protein [Candidatus Solibacter usitatus]|nr:HigA family addiction module antidote protein [Candidatus Solibacter usitatus]
MTHIPPQHPGVTIVEDILKPLGLSMNQLALELHVPATRISEICRGRRAISAETALRLSRWLGSSPDFWLGLQAQYDLDVARDLQEARIKRQIRPRKSAA